MSTYDKVYHQFEKGFFASCAMTVLVQSCVGGIAAMAVLSNGNGILQMIQLFIVVIASLAVNGAIISVQTPRTVFNLLVGGMAVCFAIAVANFLA